MLNPNEIENELHRVLPEDLKEHIPLLTSILVDSANQKISPDEVSDKIQGSEELQSAIEQLSGETINTSNATVSFGSGNQIGDVRIRDNSGRDINHFNFFLVSQKAPNNDKKSTSIWLVIGMFAAAVIAVFLAVISLIRQNTTSLASVVIPTPNISSISISSNNKSTPPIIDGKCERTNEYTDAIQVTFTDFNNETAYAYLIHDETNLYVCLNTRIGQFKDRMGTVFIDSMEPQKRRVILRVHIVESVRDTFEGPNVDMNPGGWSWTQNLDLNQYWDGASTVIPNDQESVEFRIPLTGWSRRGDLGRCGMPFRIGLYHEWVERPGTGYGWPSSQPNYHNEPEQWQLVTLTNLPCT